MGFWAQMADWVTSSREDWAGQLPGCRDGDARGWPDWVLRPLPVLLPVLLAEECHLQRGLREDQTQDDL
jgi:hypothetical protein